MAIAEDEKRRYPLAGRDAEILEGIHTLEEVHELSEDERFLLLFLRSQLEEDWREPCFQLLDSWITSKELPPEERWKKLKAVKEKWWNPAGL